MSYEYRVKWAATTNISFHGATDWKEWDGDEEAAPKEIEDYLYTGVALPPALEEALEESGFDWTVEIRERRS